MDKEEKLGAVGGLDGADIVSGCWRKGELDRTQGSKGKTKTKGSSDIPWPP